MARRGTSTPPKPKRKAARAAAPVAAVEQLLTFLIGEDEYGVSILRVREIAEYRPLRPMPMTAPWIRGVMNLRGTVVPVIDLAVRLGLEETRISRRTCLVMAEIEQDGEDVMVAVMVDGVSRVIEVPRDQIQDAPPFGLSVDFVPGLVRMDDTLIILLDLNAILASAELLDAATLLPELRGELPETVHAHQ
jgi:purine-binding chemotaxis protein CheW